MTGGIAEGKTTVLQMLAELGYETASSDAFARECFYLPAIQDGLAKILQVPVPIEPAQLGPAVAASATVRRAVNRLMHPEIVRRIEQSSAQFIEVPLLIEACLQPMFDEVWVVTSGPEKQQERISARHSAETARRLVDTQLGSFAKTPFADIVVRTNLKLETVKRYVSQEAKRAQGS